jgi:signal transduction histidine kinase
MKKKWLFLLVIFCWQQINAQKINQYLAKAFTSQDSSDYYFNLAKKNIKTIDDKGQYYFCKNARYCDYDQLDSSLFYGKKAVEVFKKTKNFPSLLTVLNNISKAYRKRGEYDKANEYLFSIMKIAEKQKKDFWIVNSYISLSLNYHDFENFGKGIYYGKIALKKSLNYKDDGKNDFVYSSLNAIAINFDDWNKPDSALYYHKKVFNYFKGNDTLQIGETYNNIGNTLLKQKKFKEAKQWILNSLAIANKKFDQNGGVKDTYYYYDRATLFTNLATISYETGDYRAADDYFAKAFENAKKCNNAEKLRDYYYQKSLFNKKRNNLKQAVEDQENYINLRDSVFAQEREKTFSELEAKYQNEKKEKELLLSKSKVVAKENEIKQKNTQFLILTLISVSLLIIVFLVYKQHKFKIKQQKQEFELREAITKIETQNKLQEQRLEISRDLHDNIGSQLTFIYSSIDNIKYAFNIVDEKLNSKLFNISDFAKSTIIELRDTIWAMNKSEITFEDFQTRLINFIEKAKIAKESLQFNIDIQKSLKQYTFSSVEGMNIYRIIQEAINNSIKHANASQINLTINSDDKNIDILIDDNGKGFQENEVDHINGLNNMRQRIKDSNGTIEIKSALNVGTKIIIHLARKDNDK